MITSALFGEWSPVVLLGGGQRTPSDATAFAGIGTTCAATDCVSTGACCDSNFGEVCVDANWGLCVGDGAGRFQGPGTVCPDLSTCPTGACRTDGGCEVLRPAECAAAGGIYEGNGTTCGGSACLCDLDGSGAVSFRDLVMLLSAWGACAAPCPEDANRDGEVAFGDLLMLLEEFGEACGAP